MDDQQILDETTSQNAGKSPINVIRLICMSCSLAALEVCYSTQAVNEIPILLAAGVQHQYIPYIWCLTPVLALFIQPYLANKSDYCQCRWGRRRPFMVAFTIGIFIGIILLGYGKAISYLIQHDPVNNALTITLVITGIWFTDYFTDALQVPGKAILLDNSIEYAQTANNISTVVASIGTIFGYGICSINWKDTFIGNLFKNEEQAVFAVAIVVAAVLFLISIVFGKEQALDDMAIIEESSNDSMSVSHSKQIDIHAQDRNYHTIISDEDQLNRISHHNKFKRCCYQYIDAIIHIPKELVILCAISVFGWIAHTSFLFFFSDFLGQVIYNGSGVAPINSSSYINYIDGVKTSSLAFIGASIIGILYTFLLEYWLLGRIGSKLSMILGLCISGIAMILVAFTCEVVAAIAYCCATEIATVTIYSIPYGLLGKYHCYYSEDPRWSSRGFATDSSILNNCLYIGTFIISITFGLLLQFGNSINVVFIAAGISNLIGAILSVFVVDPEGTSITIDIPYEDVSTSTAIANKVNA